MKKNLWLFIFLCLAHNVFANSQKTLLITGCARSGTGYTSIIFRLSGFDLLHEQVGEFGTSSWEMNYESEWVPWGAPRHGIEFVHIFHQVRHPLDSISSTFVTEPRHSWIYIMNKVPQISPFDSHLAKCAKYWYYWNIHAEEQAELTYRVEDIADVWEELEWRLGVTLDKSVLDWVSTKTNTRVPDKRHFTWDELREQLNPYLFAKIEELAYYYGYDTE